MALYSLDYLDELRRRELALVLGRTRRWFEGARILEIGAGDGAQLQILRTIGAQAIGVDMPNSAYATARRTGIVDFDGKALPFADHVFDVVYSSNVMQNVVEEPPLHREMRRVLRADGVAIHVVPSAHWRVLTSLAHYVALPSLVTRAARHYLRRAATGNGTAASPPSGVSRPSVWQHFFEFLVCPRLGEHGTWATEWWHFRARAWHRRFESLGWRVIGSAPVGLTYSGYGVLAGRLSFQSRAWLSGCLGSACRVFVMEPDASKIP